MTHVIRVEPLGDGWVVRSGHFDNDMPFHSGAAAETAARALAHRLSSAGQDAEIQILLRDGALAARFACPAHRSDSPGDPGMDLAGG